MKIFNYLLSFPLIFLSKIYIIFNIRNIRTDLKICVNIVNQQHHKIPKKFIPYLVVAEDHRFYAHYGIDPIAIFRSIYIWLLKRKIQGASTIEQQFVRVVTQRYELTLTRKIHEQILAIILTNNIDKESIARGYLAIAHYGTLYQGAKGIKKLVKVESPLNIISAVARLKYPEPMSCSSEWNSKLIARIQYINSRYKIYFS